MNWSLDARPEPRLLALPAAAASLDEAHAAIELWEFYSGKKLDSTQRLTVEVMMATRDDGSWAAMTTGREMPRQNGKGDEIEVPEFWGLIKLDEAILHTVHDAVLLATQAQERMLSLFDHKDLRRLTEGGQVWKGTGQQMIKLSTGGQIWYRTRTGGGGRGVDKIDRLVVDEAQHATHEQLASVSSTMMAAPDPQMNAIGTAALEGKSAWWWNIRKRALKGDAGAFGYVGHTAEEVWIDEEGKVRQKAPDVEDREVWRAVNPAVHAGRGPGMPFLEEEFENLGPGPFAQEHLCVWSPPPDGVGGGAISMESWKVLRDLDSLPTDETRRVCLSAPAHLTCAWFMEAGRRSDGLLHVGTRREVPIEDMDNLIALAKKLADGHGCPIIVPPGDPVLAFKAELEAAGVPLDEIKPAEYAQGCGYIKKKIEAGLLRHRGHSALDEAIARLTTKRAGQVEVWDPRASEVDLSPLVAATCALVRVPEVQIVNTYVEPLVAFR